MCVHQKNDYNIAFLFMFAEDSDIDTQVMAWNMHYGQPEICHFVQYQLATAQ